jgi:diguanylate cyclase (GGDEF)-like protein
MENEQCFNGGYFMSLSQNLKGLLFLCSLLCFSHSSFALENRFEQITTKNGLPSLRVHHAFQDSEGAMWFATDKGVSKYDGVEHEHFNTSSKIKIANDFAHKITEDKNNNIWVATEGGITKIHNSKAMNYLVKTPISSIININNTIVAASIKSVYIYSYKLNKFKEVDVFKNINNSNIFSLYEINNESILINTDVFSYSMNLETLAIKNININENTTINNVFSLNEKYIWLLTDDSGIIVYDLFTGKVVKILNTTNGLIDNAIASVSRINDELIVFYSRGGVSLFDLSTNTFVHQNNQFKNDYIVSSLISDSNTIWVSTLTSGVHYYSNLKSGSSLELYKERVSSIFKINKKIQIGTNEGVKCLRNDCKESKVDNILNVWDVKNDMNGNFLIAHDNGLSIYYPKKDILQSIQDKFPVYSISVNNETIHYAGNSSDGLIKYNSQNKISTTFLNDSKSEFYNLDTYISTILTHKENTWIATISGLINYNDKLKKELLYPLFKSISILSLEKNNDKGFWFSAQGKGVYYYNFSTDDITNILPVIEPAFKNVTNIVKDNDFLWLTTTDTIIKFNTINNSYSHYKSLLTDLDFSFKAAASFKDENLLYFRTNNGIINININEININSYIPATKITKIINKDVNVKNDKKFIFNYDANNLSFHFTSTDYAFPDNIDFSYRLVGFSDIWKNTKNNYVDFTNLTFGKYTFEVKSSNSDGLWNKKSEKYSFEIKKPWWLYALLVLTISLVLCFAFILRNRIKQMKFLKEKAITDDLTGIYNRYKFTLDVESKINDDHPFSLLFIDLDFFKEINDSLGHDAGDLYICHIANTLKNIVSEHGIVARIGGDEFAILLHNNNIRHSTHILIEDIHNEINKQYTLKNKIIKGSASIGVVFFPDNGTSTQELLQHADVAMYYSKNKGRNIISYFKNEMIKDFNEKSEIRYLLQHALSKNEFELYYQPKVCSKTEKYIGFESLIRWNSKEKGFISPMVFIPEAENNGTILAIGDWVIYETCKQASLLDKQGLLKDNISLNMSPIQFMQKNVHLVIKDALTKYELNPSKIEIEITESVFASDTETILEVMNKIKSLGVSIALDDFGAGYSSLSYLTLFPIDTLKIDRAFIKDLKSGSKNETVLKNIFVLADDLGMSVVVEGVETEYQLDIVSKYKFKSIQGYLYSPPITSDKILKKLLEQKKGIT